jgi:hypothetical protein
MHITPKQSPDQEKVTQDVGTGDEQKWYEKRIWKGGEGRFQGIIVPQTLRVMVQA